MALKRQTSPYRFSSENYHNAQLLMTPQPLTKSQLLWDRVASTDQWHSNPLSGHSCVWISQNGFNQIFETENLEEVKIVGYQDHGRPLINPAFKVSRTVFDRIAQVSQQEKTDLRTAWEVANFRKKSFMIDRSSPIIRGKWFIKMKDQLQNIISDHNSEGQLGGFFRCSTAFRVKPFQKSAGIRVDPSNYQDMIPKWRQLGAMQVITDPLEDESPKETLEDFENRAYQALDRKLAQISPGMFHQDMVVQVEYSTVSFRAYFLPQVLNPNHYLVFIFRHHHLLAHAEVLDDLVEEGMTYIQEIVNAIYASNFKIISGAYPGVVYTREGLKEGYDPSRENWRITADVNLSSL